MLLDNAHARTLSGKAGAGIPDTRDAQGHCLIKRVPHDADMLLDHAGACGHLLLDHAGCRCATESRGCRSAGMCRSMPGCAGAPGCAGVPGCAGCAGCQVALTIKNIWFGCGLGCM